MRRVIPVKFQNGLSFEYAVKELLADLNEEFEFIDSDQPDFIIFGPYGNDLPPKGKYSRIGYFCENIKPDLSICEWAFGIPHERYVGDPRYQRIQWHGLDPARLVKPPGYDPDQIAAAKNKFCNFLYSHRVAYREAFFTQLSAYRQVDAPGKSMRNMPGIDGLYQGDKWEIKRQFLSPYKFTIAFENDIFPGYQTEKLYDAMQADSIPIYCGDPFIGEIFDTGSFINAWDYLPKQNSWLADQLMALAQMDFEDMRPAFLKTPLHRIKRNTKTLLREYKMALLFKTKDFAPLTDHIRAVDSDPARYRDLLAKPWFKDNRVPEALSAKQRWKEIFNS